MFNPSNAKLNGLKYFLTQNKSHIQGTLLLKCEPRNVVMRLVKLAHFDSYIVLEEACALLGANYFKKCVFNNLCAFFGLNKFLFLDSF